MAVHVEIFGQVYALRAEADEEHVRKVAQLVDTKMREAAAGSRSVATLQVAVLAALDLASECLQNRSRVAQWQAEVEARSATMVARIEDQFPEVRVP